MSLSPLLIFCICLASSASFAALDVLGTFAWLLWKRASGGRKVPDALAPKIASPPPIRRGDQASSEIHKQDLELCQSITEQSGEYLARTHPGILPIYCIAVLVLDKEKWCMRWGLPYSEETEVYSVVHDEGVEYLLCFKSQKDMQMRGILVETMFLREHAEDIRKKLGCEMKAIGDHITLDDGSFDKTPWVDFSFISK